MEQVPGFVSVVFEVTTFVTVGFFLWMVRPAAERSAFGKALLFLIPFWLVLQYVLGLSGFYQNTAALPPRLFVFGVAPTLVLAAAALLAERERFISSLPLSTLTLIHVVRIPVEMTLSWLSAAGAVPQTITYHGTNFDLVSGLTAPIAYYFAVKKNANSRRFLIFWNLAALALLLNVVITAVLSVPSPIQQLAFDRPNLAVLYSPFLWLPTVVVPIVLFCHLASLYQLLRGGRG